MKKGKITETKKTDVKIRSEFATVKMPGAGPHKSYRDYDRSQNKKKIEEELER